LASSFEETGYVSRGDPRRQNALNRWRAALERDDTSRTGQHVSARADRTQIHTSLPGSGERAPRTLGRVLAFGFLAWTTGILLAIFDQADQFSRTSIIGVLLLLGILAFLVGLVLIAQRMRPAIRHVLVEAEVRDPLTGLPNERYLLLRLEEEMAPAHRHERLLTLAVLDINGLAAINEQYGRDCGDEALRHVATVVQATKRAADVLARLADDEFAVILTECSSEGGQAFVRRLTERLAREPARVLLDNRPSHIWVGVCAGLADMQSEHETPASLLDRARADVADAREERDRRRELWRTA
jgi:diguanylate cyclase (GGDEF)-like protein